MRRTAVGLRPAAVAVAVLLATAAGAAEPAIERLDPRFDALVPPDAALEKVVDGHDWLEGPLWDGVRGGLLFTDIPRNAVYRWRPEAGVALELARAGYGGEAPFRGREPGANGLAFDAAGRLVLCQHGDRRIARVEPDGRRTTLAERFEGRRLNSPNDLTFRSDGTLWFTDPPFGLPGVFDDPGRELPFTGVFRLAADGALALATREVPWPNGLAFSPDEGTLYVSSADPAAPVWWAFEVGTDGALASPRVVFDAREGAAGRLGFRVGSWPGNADGLEVDRAGTLFAAGPAGVWVIAPPARARDRGVLLGRVVLGTPTSNVAFGEDGRTLFVTAGPAIWRLRLAPGAPGGRLTGARSSRHRIESIARAAGSRSRHRP